MTWRKQEQLLVALREKLQIADVPGIQLMLG
jgi:hypothetical protein